jgi:predicted dithiol-disulfide oxidoreductase (DUF899 family)
LGFPFGSHFNHDFGVAHTEAEQRSGVVEYNFRETDVRATLEAGNEGPLADFAASAGTDWATFTREAPVAAAARESQWRGFGGSGAPARSGAVRAPS